MTTINLFRFPEEDMVIHTAGGDITENKSKEVDFENEQETDLEMEQEQQ